jgi:hypothetical protein
VHELEGSVDEAAMITKDSQFFSVEFDYFDLEKHFSFDFHHQSDPLKMSQSWMFLSPETGRVNWSVTITVTRILLREGKGRHDTHQQRSTEQGVWWERCVLWCGDICAYLCPMIEKIFNNFIICRVSSTMKHGHVGGGRGDVDEIRGNQRREDWIAVDGKIMQRSEPFFVLEGEIRTQPNLFGGRGWWG